MYNIFYFMPLKTKSCGIRVKRISDFNNWHEIVNFNRFHNRTQTSRFVCVCFFFFFNSSYPNELPIFTPSKITKAFFQLFFFLLPSIIRIGLHSCWHVPSGIRDSGDFYFTSLNIISPPLCPRLRDEKMVHAL